MSRRFRGIDGVVDGLVIPGVYKLTNGMSNPLLTSTTTNPRINSLYALTSFSYDDKIFMDLTGRNDWSSTLPSQNNSFFYPSISSSFILNELLPLPASVSLAKAATVGGAGG